MRSFPLFSPPCRAFRARKPAHLARMARQRRRPGTVRADISQAAARSGTLRGAGIARRGNRGGTAASSAAPLLAALYALLFDFLNHRTGRLDPSLDAIAAKAGCCRRAVVDALARLRDLGLLAWRRRCEQTRDAEGRFRLRQRTNAYGLLPPSQWLGYRDNEPPPPDPATLGAPE